MTRSQLHLLTAVTIIIAGHWPVLSMAASDKCEPPVARIVSVQGRVEAQRAPKTEWEPARLSDTYCPGDTIRVDERSRAAITLINETILRLDQNTTVTFTELEDKDISWLTLLRGAIYFFSRVPRTLKVNTPFVNAAVEGTEFLFRVEQDQAILTVFEGTIAANNPAGTLVVRAGESALARRGEAPQAHLVVRPKDAVQWALYYPPIVDYRPSDFPGGSQADWQTLVRRSIEFYRQGNLAAAFSSIKAVPEDVRDPRFFTYRAALLLTVGRVEEAATDIDKALGLDAESSHAFALLAIIAVVQNEQDKAFDLAVKAVALDARSAAARVALSYVQQAKFDLTAALTSVEEAVNLSPDDALGWARLSELWLSLGYLDKALKAAKQAVSQNPNLAHTQSVLGFAYLTRIKIRDAIAAFEEAIVLDQAAPLPRLGLGLARIRAGDLKDGRKEIETAASLDPTNSLIRSYLGKAFYEEKHDNLAASQYALAKQLDPLDPTPWFYDAIRLQTINRPVEALYEIKKSIDLNDNRAVFRSRLLLDQDLAARSAAQARIYRDLGFEQLALVQGWKSVNSDPSDFSGHRFLADTYSALPRHEIARVSELLQSQLLQPINITPLQPQLAESNLLLLSGAGTSDPAFNEFNPLFTRDRLAFLLNGVAGENDTLGTDLVFSGVEGRSSFSIGRFYFETEGFRDNADIEQDIGNIFAQFALSHKHNFQVELRSTETEHGDITLRIDPLRAPLDFRRSLDTDAARLGYHYAPSPRSDLIASYILQDRAETVDQSVPAGPLVTTANLMTEPEASQLEVQYQFHANRFDLIGGIGNYDEDSTVDSIINITLGGVPISTSTSSRDTDIDHDNAYLYSLIRSAPNIIWTVGASYDWFESPVIDRDQLNPKFGVIWNATPRTTVRAAAFRVLKRAIASNQTIEPTQVAGFNQFFDDANATDAIRYGAALDQTFSPALSAGVELTARDLEVPKPLVGGGTREEDQDEQLHRAYVYWTPHTRVAFSAEYIFEDFNRDVDPAFIDPNEPNLVRTQRFPLAVNYYHPNGFFTGLIATYVDHEVELPTSAGGTDAGDDRFWIADLALGYRLPKRRGILSIVVKNLFDEDFRFQDRDFEPEDPGLPSFQPERAVFGRFTLAF